MTTSKIRIAVVGAGKMGTHHARALSKLPDVELVGAHLTHELLLVFRAPTVVAGWALFRFPKMTWETPSRLCSNDCFGATIGRRCSIRKT